MNNKYYKRSRIPEAAAFSLLVSIAVLEKILSFSLYLFFTMLPRFGGRKPEITTHTDTTADLLV